uniref:Putative effector protein n=1 Tax=Heterodera avenae TaxID=34510 RepID=A0A2L0VDM5_HETAV|nr:putative effector protein [Heterodera avenae]
MMDRRFTIFLMIALVTSIYEVLSNGHANEGDDSFKQFDDLEEEPSYKYSTEAQKGFGVEEEEVTIREPSGARDSFKLPINMPPVKFAFCVSCGYRQAYEQFAQILREKYPGIDVHGENYPPGILRAVGAQILGIVKIALIVCVVSGRSPFPALGLDTPTFFQWMLSNRLSAALMLFLFSNAIEGMLQSTGAFEIYIESDLIWSKLESGRVPSPPELIQAIDSHLAIRGGGAGRFGSSSSFGIDES